jgi:uncharacterized protein (TIGR02271 family)
MVVNDASKQRMTSVREQGGTSMQRETRTDRFVEIEDRFAAYEVYDPTGSKIGKVDDLFVDEGDQPEYLGVKMGLLGTKSTHPLGTRRGARGRGAHNRCARQGSGQGRSCLRRRPGDHAKVENEVYSYYGLQQTGSTEDRGSYADYTSGTTGESAGSGMAMGDTDSGEFREHPPAKEGVSGEGAEDLEDEDELRVQRSEEELRAGTREREAGQLKVRKRVRTDREQIEVPTRHEEVSVVRVPVEGEATEAEIGDDEVSVPVTEEEVVVEKRPVAKEEVRIRKDVVSDTETVEEDVRREEVEVEDETERRGGL